MLPDLIKNIKLEKVEKSPSHHASLKLVNRGGWQCNRIKGFNICMARGDHANAGRWRHPKDDFDMCGSCLKVEKHLTKYGPSYMCFGHLKQSASC
jgi:hypothetical protein